MQGTPHGCEEDDLRSPFRRSSARRRRSPSSELTGLYCHRMSAKAKRQLMLRRSQEDGGPAVGDRSTIRWPSSWIRCTSTRAGTRTPTCCSRRWRFKAAMATAALTSAGHHEGRRASPDLPARTRSCRSSACRELRMDITRSADMNRTPDVRTRAYFRKWATAGDRLVGRAESVALGGRGAAAERWHGLRHRATSGRRRARATTARSRWRTRSPLDLLDSRSLQLAR